MATTQWAASCGARVPEWVDIQVPGQLDREGGINDHGQVCGVGLSIDGAFATVRQPNGGITRLPQPDGDIGTMAYDINNSGQAVGFLDDNTDINNEHTYAVLWDIDGEIVTLGGGDELWSRATDINNVGQAVWTREIFDPVERERSYRWDSLNGSVPLAILDGTNYSVASAINDGGQIVGKSGGHAVLWTSPDTIVDLGTAEGPSGETGLASGINNHGQIVGGLGGRAVLWNSDGSLAADLSSFLTGTGYSAAYAINDNGWIVGVQGDAYSNSHAILWEPVPEPSSILTLVSGMACLAVVLKRRDLAESVNPPAS